MCIRIQKMQYSFINYITTNYGIKNMFLSIKEKLIK